MRARSALLAVSTLLYRVVTFGARGSAADLRRSDAVSTFRSMVGRAFDTRGLVGALATLLRELLSAAVCAWRSLFDRAGGGIEASPVRHDLWMATRSLKASPAAALIAASTLALGIGVNASAFSAIDSMMWRPMPFPDADRLAELTSVDVARGMSYTSMPTSVAAGWAGQRDLFDRVEGYDARSFVLRTAAATQHTSGAVVTPGLFDVFDTPVVMGRRFMHSDGSSRAEPVALVSHRFWREQLGSATDLDRLEIVLDDRRHRVIGVTAPAFRFPDAATAIWVPRALEATPRSRTRPLAKLAGGVALAYAADQVTRRAESINESYGGSRGVGARLITPDFSADDRTQSALTVLAGAVALLFLIVCANVANLTLSKAVTRARDLATIHALGASRRALVRTAFFEQMLIGVAGTLGGCAVAVLALQFAEQALPASLTGEGLNPVDLDLRALLFLGAAGLVATLTAGIAAVAMALRGSTVHAIGNERRTVSGSKAASRFRSWLALAEVAMSVVLLFSAIAVTRSFVGLVAADHGYEPDGLVTLRLGLPASGYQDSRLRDQVALDIAERVAALPGVLGATAGTIPSEANIIAHGPLEIAGQSATPAPVTVPVHEVAPSYFDVVRLPIRDGGTFQAAHATNHVVINRRFASRYFPANDSVGQRFRIGKGHWREVVGVADDTLGDRERGSRRAEFFYPLGGATDGLFAGRATTFIADFRTVLARTDDPQALIRLLPAAVHDRDPSVVVWSAKAVTDELAASIARPKAIFVLVSVFAGAGLVLSLVGLYGVLAHLVVQRRAEIGVRIALGATTGHVHRLVVRQATWMTLGGLLLGGLALWPTLRFLRSVLIDVAPLDTVGIVTTVGVMVITAGAACWYPTRTAGRMDPVTLLRE